MIIFLCATLPCIAWLYEHTDAKVEVIALECGCCATTVREVARLRGLPRRTGRERRVDADHIALLYRAGMGPAEIAGEAGCSRDTVQRIVRARGLVGMRHATEAANARGKTKRPLTERRGCASCLGIKAPQPPLAMTAGTCAPQHLTRR